MKTTVLMAAMIAGFMLPALDASAEGRGQHPDFATLDADADGAVTMAEMEAHGNARFVDADTDGDGMLSQSELAAQVEGRAAQALERMLSRLDANGDGNISIDELPDRGDRVARMFENADKDESGALSAEEFEDARPQRGRDGHGGRDHGDRHRDGHGHRGRG